MDAHRAGTVAGHPGSADRDKDPETALKDAKSDIESILEDNHFYEDILPQLVPAE